MFPVKKCPKRELVRLRNLRNSLMADDVDLSAAGGDGDGAEEVLAEGDNGLVQPPVEDAQLADAGEWRDHDDEFFDFLLADANREDTADADEPAEGDEDQQMIEQVRHSRWPQPSDASDVCVFLAGLQAKRDVPVAVVCEMLDYMNENREVFAAALLSGQLPNFKTIRNRAARNVPRVLMDVAFRDSTGSLVTYEAREHFPQKEMLERNLTREYVLYYVSPAAVLDYHRRLHPDVDSPEFFDLSLDGIPESKSGGRSVDVLSIRYSGCKTIYSIAILQPARKAMGLPDDLTLSHFLPEYDGDSVPLRYVIADAPKRASLSGLKQHSAKHACQYCLAEKSDRVFPWETCFADVRTNEGTRRAAAAGDASLGVKKPSPLRDIESLDLINHIPAEKLHLIDLGVVRKLIQLAFKCPQFKAKQVEFQRADDALLNADLDAAKGLPNFSRRTRALDTANYKGEEYRNLALVYWPLVKKHAPSVVVNHWLLTVFIYRAMILPDPEYRAWQQKYDMKGIMRAWYREFEAVYGKQNCSYNPHTFHHLPEVRKLGPLSSTAAYDFENHFNLLKKSYRPGTASIGQQALSSLLVAANHGHTCGRKKSVSGKVTRKSDDSWCFVEDVGIVSVSSATDVSVTGKLVAVEERNKLLQGLDFNDVWAFRMRLETRDSEEETYLMSSVLGKCVVVDRFVSVLPWDVVLE